MRWVKKGKIFTASGEFGWMNSHTQVPTALVLDDVIRVFFSTRPDDGMSRVAAIDLGIDDPLQIRKVYDQPILGLGDPGMFDEHGVIPNHVFWHEGLLYMYYVGWSRRQSIPYSNWMGMAVSDDAGVTFQRCYPGPILDRTRDEVHSATGLICVKGPDGWFGWYATGTQWLLVDGRYEHTYELRSCSSENLIDWIRPNEPIFQSNLTNESSTRPTVILMNDLWHMWFCYRGTQDFRDGQDSYRIGYAWSTDLVNWTRADNQAGIDVGVVGWDSSMVTYPCVVTAQGRTFMFYSGNGFGRAGFGYAELEFD